MERPFTSVEVKHYTGQVNNHTKTNLACSSISKNTKLRSCLSVGNAHPLRLQNYSNWCCCSWNIKVNDENEEASVGQRLARGKQCAAMSLKLCCFASCAHDLQRPKLSSPGSLWKSSYKLCQTLWCFCALNTCPPGSRMKPPHSFALE